MSYLQVLSCLVCVLSVGLADVDEDRRGYACAQWGISPYPYMVSLAHRRLDAEYNHTCGGTLLTDRHILTTASCFKNKMDLVMWQVRAATLCATYGGQLRTISNVTMHPPTDKGVLSDLAIVKLSEKLDNDFNARPARLPEKDADPLTASTPTIIGWGEDESGVPTEILNYAIVTLVDTKSCASRMKKTWGLKAGILCTSEHGPGVPAPCRGDVGGPLLVDGDVVRGVIARIPAKCAAVGSDDAYVDIAMYIDWIKSVAGLE